MSDFRLQFYFSFLHKRNSGSASLSRLISVPPALEHSHVHQHPALIDLFHSRFVIAENFINNGSVPLTVLINGANEPVCTYSTRTLELAHLKGTQWL